MRLNPKTIYAKGLILISVPLLVELAFGITMFALQRYYDAKLNQERAAVEIIFHANEMWINCTQLMYMKGYYSFFGGATPSLEDRKARLITNHNVVKNLVAHDPEQTKNLENVWAYTNQSMVLGNQLRPVVSKNLSGREKMAAMTNNLDIIAKAAGLVDLMAPEFRKFREPEFLNSPAAGPEVEKSTTLVDRIVLGSLAASTLVAVLLFTFFIRSINRGVKIVVENTERFKQGKELEPRSTRSDELAQVDAAFHDMAEEIKEAQRAKQAIVSMISHDLRSPLTSVLGYFSSLSSGIFGDASSETISGAEKYERAVERLIRLINDLLDLDKIEAGKFELRPKALSVEQIIEQAITAVMPSATEKGVTIHGADSTAEIYADPDRIVRAVANVLSTAVRLSPSGLYVETTVGQHDGETEIRVISSGASISEEQLGSLFDRYQQSEADLRLELPLSKEIVRLHGGSIGAISEQQQGLTFWLRLPDKAPASS